MPAPTGPTIPSNKPTWATLAAVLAAATSAAALAVSLSVSGTLSATKDDAVANGITAVATFAHTTTGTPAPGIGTGVALQAEGAGGTQDLGGLQCILTNVGDGTEETTCTGTAVTAGGDPAGIVSWAGDGTLTPMSSGAVSGFMSAAQYSKLDGVEASADVTDFTNVSAALAAASGPVAFNSQSITGVNDVGAATATLTGDLAVNGEDITCDTAGAATVFNTTATSVSIAGAGDLNVSGGSGSTGCTVTGATGALVCTGDGDFATGYQFSFGSYAYQDLTPAGASIVLFMGYGAAQSTTPQRPQAGSVRAVNMNLSGNAAGDTLTVTVLKNGGLLWLGACVIAVAQSKCYATATRGTYAYAAGDTIGVQVTLGASWTATTVDAVGYLKLQE